MKLASFEFDGTALIGISTGDNEIVDVTDIVGSDMIRLIELAEHMLPQLGDASSNKQLARYATDKVRWLPPVRKPGKICCIANRDSNSSDDGAREPPEFVLKPASCLVGHGEPIVVRNYFGHVRPGPGLAVVVGKKAKDVDAVDADDCIFGYTVFNDVTRANAQCSSSADSFGSMGPWLVTADAIHDPGNLDVDCLIAGEVIARSNTRLIRYEIAELISYLSQFHTLEAGDVIGCSPVFDVAIAGTTTEQVNLADADSLIEVRVADIGALANPVVVEDRNMGNWHL